MRSATASTGRRVAGDGGSCMAAYCGALDSHAQAHREGGGGEAWSHSAIWSSVVVRCGVRKVRVSYASGKLPYSVVDRCVPAAASLAPRSLRKPISRHLRSLCLSVPSVPQSEGARSLLGFTPLAPRRLSR
jgi:hypothetical protein